MLRPTTLLRAFAAPARRILPLQAAAAVPLAAPSSVLFRRLQSTTPPSESDPTPPQPEAEAAEAPAEVEAAHSTSPAPEADPSSTLSRRERNHLKYSASLLRKARKARKLEKAQQQAEQAAAAPAAEPATTPESSTTPESPASSTTPSPDTQDQQPPTKPQRLRPKIRTPLPGLPYHVSRTPYAELPVYELAKRGGNKKLTNVKKVEGDKAVFREQLAEGLSLQAADIKLNTLTGHVVVPVCIPGLLVGREVLTFGDRDSAGRRSLSGWRRRGFERAARGT